MIVRHVWTLFWKQMFWPKTIPECLGVVGEHARPILNNSRPIVDKKSSRTLYYKKSLWKSLTPIKEAVMYMCWQGPEAYFLHSCKSSQAYMNPGQASPSPYYLECGWQISAFSKQVNKNRQLGSEEIYCQYHCPLNGLIGFTRANI